MRDVDTAPDAELVRVNGLVTGGVLQHGVGVHAGLVMKSGAAGYGRVEGHLNADLARHHLLNLAQQRQVVLAHQIWLDSVESLR